MNGSDQQFTPIEIGERLRIARDEANKTQAEAAEARSKVDTLSKDPRNRRLVVWHQEVVDRHERQKAGTYHRKNENLKIDVWGPDEGPTNVSYTLSSQNQ